MATARMRAGLIGRNFAKVVLRVVHASLGLVAILALASCSLGKFRLFHPAGPLAATQLDVTMIDVGVMLLIILPTGVMIGVFAWRYRKSRNATYDPTWTHSLPVELLVWGVPFVIVIVLGIVSFKSIVMVNPYGPTVLNTHANPDDPAAAAVDINVITTDWQWFFIYPKQHVATIDELVVPVGTPVSLQLTSTSVMNDFFVPQLAPMIDVMPGMRTKDAFRADHIRDYTGFSADFSGAGFSWMQFATRIVSTRDFNRWVSSVRKGPDQLSYAAFQKLARPTVNYGAKPVYFSKPQPGLFDEVIGAAKRGVVYPDSAAVNSSVAVVRNHAAQHGASS